MIDESLLSSTIAQSPAGDLLVFAYGSLMWSPDFCHYHKQGGKIFGYHRRCCVFSTHYRGTPSRPGLVLGLDRGGCCQGILYHVAESDKAMVIRYLFEREMFANVYSPCYVGVLANNQQLTALTFVVRRDGKHYAPPLSHEQTLNIIRHASGQAGRNIDYILNTHQRLSTLNLRCSTLTKLHHLLTAN